MPVYDFKLIEEIAWVALVAAAVAALEVIVGADLAKVVDWRAWTIALGAAAVRAAAAAILARLPAPSTTGSKP